MKTIESVADTRTVQSAVENSASHAAF